MYFNAIMDDLKIFDLELKVHRMEAHAHQQSPHYSAMNTLP